MAKCQCQVYKDSDFFSFSPHFLHSENAVSLRRGGSVAIIGGNSYSITVQLL